MYNTPPATSQKIPMAGIAWIIGPKAITTSQPMAMYKTDENHLGHVIQQALMIVPKMAMPHTMERRVMPKEPFKTIRQTGVYDPAIK